MSFRRAPDWQKTGDPVDGVWKMELLIYLQQLFGFKTLIETGTCEGSTLLRVHPHFEKIYSIELSPKYHNIAKQRLAGVKNVELILGDSAVEIKRLFEGRPGPDGRWIPGIKDEPTLFWLDAHASAPDGAGFNGENGDPVVEELRIITERRQGALIVIDDEPDASLRRVDEAGVNLTDWIRDYRTGEVILAKWNGGYFIPPFE